jgi:cytochrome c-type biogenesis protein CcmE
MNRLDEELAQAVRRSEQDAADPPPADQEPVVLHLAPSPGKPTCSRRNLGLLAALLGISGAVLAVVLTSGEAAVYSKGVDQLVQDKARLTGRNVRVDGRLVEGTLKRRDRPCEYRFTLAKNGATVAVRYAQCVVPDTFRDVPGMKVHVTVEGQLDQDGYFEADQILAKCPSKYEEQMKQGTAVPYPEAESVTSFEGRTRDPARVR